MTVAMHYYKKSGGRPLCSGPVALDRSGAVTVLVTGVEGKRIVPMWLLHCFTFTGSPTTMIWYAGGTTTANYFVYASKLINHNRMKPQFFDFDKMNCGPLAIGESFGHLYAANYTTLITAGTPFCTVGYYLLDV